MYSTHNEVKFFVAEIFLVPQGIKFTNIWVQYQKMCILVN